MLTLAWMPAGEGAQTKPASRRAARTASVLYRQGARLAKHRRCRQAVTRLEQAYLLDPQPLRLYPLADCHHRLGQLRLAHSYLARFAATVPAAQRAELQRKLEQLRLGAAAKLAIATDPGGATVMVDGNRVTRTPEDGSEATVSLAGGEHRLQLLLGGYQPKTVELSAEFGEAQRLSLTLEPLPKAAVLVEANLEAGEVSVDGIWVGRTPLRLEVEPGEHQVAVSKDGHQAWEGSLRATLDAPTTVRVTLTRLAAKRPRQSGLVLTVPLATAPSATAPPTIVPSAGAAPVVPATADLGGTRVAGADREVAAGLERDKQSGEESGKQGKRRGNATPIYKRWWLWTIVGAAVAGGAAAAIVVTQKGGGTPGGTFGGMYFPCLVWR